MGFWSNLKAAVTSAANVVKEKAKSAGRAIGEKFQEWGQSLSNRFSQKIEESSTKIDQIGKYDGDKNTDVKVEIDINNELARFSKEIEDIADEIEEKCLKECNVYYRDLIESFGNNDSDIDMSAFDNFISDTKKSVKGCLKKRISKEVSIENEELVKILGMRSGPSKDEKIKSFQKKVINDSVNNLCVEINKIVKNQDSFIERYFEDMFNTMDKSLENDKSDLEKLKTLLNNEDEKLQEILNNYMTVSACDFVLNEVS